MPRKVHQLPGIGEVVFVKRRNSKNLRLTIDSRGQVKVSLPLWAPYAIGTAFVKSRRDWIAQRVAKQKPPRLHPGARIGRKHHLQFIRQPGLKRDRTRVADCRITITSSLPFEAESVQAIAYSACERALKIEAKTVLPPRLKEQARRHGYRYGKVRVKKLTSRWGSCSAQNDISLSYFLIQLPAELIDYVILHELIHTRYLNHGPDFWAAFTKALPAARRLQKQIRTYHPRVEPT